MGDIIFFPSNMHFDVCYHPAKFKIKIQLVYGETKEINCIMR